MKRLQKLTMVLLAMGSLTMTAQTTTDQATDSKNPLTIGARIGANIGNVQVDGLSEIITPDIESLNGFAGGIYVNKVLDDKLSLTTGLHYKRKGFVAREAISLDVFNVDIPVGARAETRIHTLEVPILLNYTFNKSGAVLPYIEVGPAFSYAAAAEIQPIAEVIIEVNLPSVDLDLSKDRYNRFEVAAQGVAGIKIPYGRGEFDLGLSYTHALTELLNDPLLNVRMINRGIGIHAGFGMRI